MINKPDCKSQPKLFHRLLPAYCLLPTAFCLLAIAVQAHDPGLSSAELRLESGWLVAHLTFARGDIEPLVVIDADKDGRATPAEFAHAWPRLAALGLELIEARFDGAPVVTQEVTVQLDESNAIHFRLAFPERGASRLSLRSTIIARLARGHRQHFLLRDDQGNVLAEQMFGPGNNAFETDLASLLPSSSKLHSMGQFLVLGVKHILTGYDHLTFLLGLLLAGSSFAALVRIITSFTVAHSITLALGALNLINIPSRLVEPLIAISIIYVGIENIFRRNLDRRSLLTFAFGLAHGLGFSSALRELGIGSGSGVVVPLLSFNLGVELGQIAIAILFLPFVWKLKDHPSFTSRYSPICSLLIALAGGYWLIERVLLN